jgi:SAM-dependent MidA family methyltransferase
MSPLRRKIYEEIQQYGPIPFARFMELALYCPDYGFYEGEKDNVGRGGDFYTSVSVGPLFGELLAFQFASWLGELRIADCGLRIVEAGAHDGKLAGDILGWLRRQRPEVAGRTEYCIIEPSARRREWQRQTLADLGDQIHWAQTLSESRLTPHASRFTIIFSNELLDAMPVRRFGWDAAKRAWFEWGVASDGDRFIWTRLFPAPLLGGAGGGFSEFPSSPELLEALPDGYTLEISPAAEQWWSKAARALQHGKLLTFDYGFDAASAIIPERPNGTLRAYRQHQQSGDVLADPGEQDLTAHVNFPRIQRAGEVAGLKTEVFDTQGRFLTHLAAEAWKPESRFGAWDSKRTRQFQTLTHPAHLGQSFRVLIQSRA